MRDSLENIVLDLWAEYGWKGVLAVAALVGVIALLFMLLARH